MHHEAGDKFPDIKKVLTNHSRGSAYMRQFFKLPLISPCDCVACEKDFFSELVIPEEVYHDIPLLPLPITQDSHGDLHYMKLEEALAQPFTDKRQPSLAQRQKARLKSITSGLHHPRRRYGNTRHQWGKSRHSQAVELKHGPWRC